MSIKKLDDGRYLLDVRPNGRNGKRIRRVFDKKSDAQATERYILVHAESREFINGCRERRTLGQLFDAWWVYHGQHQRNAALVKVQLGKVIRDLGENTRVTKLSRLQVMSYRSERLQAGIKPSTINRDIVRLSGMFTALIKIGLYKGEHPVRGIEKLYVEPSEMAFLSLGEIDRLLGRLEGDYRRIAVLCLSTGARWGEASRLRAEQVVNQRVTFLRTKNGHARTVPISLEVQRDIKTKEGGLLFDVEYKEFRRIIREVKPDLPAGQATHVLRHTFASHFIMNGGNIIALQRMLGHSTIQQTMTYAHFAPDYLQDAVALNPLGGGTYVHEVTTL